MGMIGAAHRNYLSDFYEGGFAGSFAQGALFQENPLTGDKRISGSFASLAGLEKARDAGAVDLAVQRILMGHALIAGFGGIPLIYMGDELAVLNDYGYLSNSDHVHDSRWIHRPVMDWDVAALRAVDDLPSGRVFRGVKHILARRRATPALHAATPTRVLRTEQTGVFAVARLAPTGTVLCLYNFTENWAHLGADWARAQGVSQMHDALSDAPVATPGGIIALPPHARVWLT